MTAIKVSEATPEQVQAALELGHLREVVIFCDDCGIEMATDMIGETPEERIDGALVGLRVQDQAVLQHLHLFFDRLQPVSAERQQRGASAVGHQQFIQGQTSGLHGQDQVVKFGQRVFIARGQGGAIARGGFLRQV